MDEKISDAWKYAATGVTGGRFALPLLLEVRHVLPPTADTLIARLYMCEIEWLEKARPART
jgi:hypothetical protein